VQTTDDPGTQAPAPSQTRPEVMALAPQTDGSQEVPWGCRRQAPAPSQVPSRPQLAVDSAEHCPVVRGGTPRGIAVQVPWKPGTLQAWQVSWQALLQQNPSTQLPLPHSPAQTQASPLRLLPSTAASAQEPGTLSTPFVPPSGLGIEERSNLQELVPIGPRPGG
jgi:hypothetical protein